MQLKKRLDLRDVLEELSGRGAGGAKGPPLRPEYMLLVKAVINGDYHISFTYLLIMFYLIFYMIFRNGI